MTDPRHPRLRHNAANPAAHGIDWPEKSEDHPENITAATRVPIDHLRSPEGDIWVFAYGSLMWNPGFDYVERRAAFLDGFARRFCLWSMHYRGTEAAPGLVLGLTESPGASTRGAAFRVQADIAGEVLAYLGERELISAAYREVAAPLRFLSGDARPVAVTYVVDVAHRQCAAALPLEAQAEIIAFSRGLRGDNREYLFNTVDHLREDGFSETEIGELGALERMVRARLSDA